MEKKQISPTQDFSKKSISFKENVSLEKEKGPEGKEDHPVMDRLKKWLYVEAAFLIAIIIIAILPEAVTMFVLEAFLWLVLAFFIFFVCVWFYCVCHSLI